MKKILAVAALSIFGLTMLFTSCKKSTTSTSSGNFYCKCGYKTSKGADSIVAQTSYTGYYSHDKAAVQCSKYQTTIQSSYPGSTCSIDE